MVFLDTVGLLALWDESDQWHSHAESAFQGLLQGGVVMITTSYILLKCGNAAARRPYRQAVARLRHALDVAHCLIEPTADDVKTAWEAYERNEAAAAGIVDQVSLVAMRRLGLRKVFTNDKHFAAAGFEVLF